jgi:putative redox protein
MRSRNFPYPTWRRTAARHLPPIRRGGLIDASVRSVRRGTTLVKIRPKTIITHRIRGTRTSEARTDLTVRGHAITIDERVESGGSDHGISPVETLLTALIGCTNRITHKAADRHGVNIKNMAIDLESRFDRRGTQLIEEINVPFPQIELKIEMETDAADEAIEKVKSDLRRFCPVAKVLRQAGTAINESWTIKRS